MKKREKKVKKFYFQDTPTSLLLSRNDKYERAVQRSFSIHYAYCSDFFFLAPSTQLLAPRSRSVVIYLLNFCLNFYGDTFRIHLDLFRRLVCMNFLWKLFIYHI